MSRLIRVFIADASRESVQLLRELLEREEDLAVVGSACRGDEALRAVPESGADVLLCDLLLPGLDGLSLLRRLKADGALPHAIVLSGFYNDSIARAVSPVTDLYLPKPCSAEELAHHIRACFLGTEGIAGIGVRAAVRNVLQEACLMPHLDGSRYLQSALERTWANPLLLRGVTKSLYRDVAREFGTTSACVERSMRAAIERAWERMGESVRLRIFGPQALQWDKAPSNVPFLTAMTAYLESGNGARRLGGGAPRL